MTESASTPPAFAPAPAPSTASDWRTELFRLCFAAVAGAAVAQAVTLWWPRPAFDPHAIGFAVWAHQPPGLQTVYYLAFLAGLAAAYATAPMWLRWARGNTAPSTTGTSPATDNDFAPWIGWLWVAAAAVLPWQAAHAGKLLVLIAFVAWLERALRRRAADPARWRRLQLGLSVASIGYGLGLLVLDLSPAPTRGMLDWYNPVLVGATVLTVVGLWHTLAARLSRRDPRTDGELRAAWRLLPLGAAPCFGLAWQLHTSPWGTADGAAGASVSVAVGLGVALFAGGMWMAVFESRQVSAVEGTAAHERFLNRVAWIVWPLIFFAMTHERNLRMIGFSQHGPQFDFMHWGEWWDPWWRLQCGGKLWVDVFPIHGVGYDIGPCKLAEWLGDATLSGRIQVVACLNGISFGLFYLGLLSLSRRRSVALFALAVLLWDQPSWYKVWIADPRFLPLFAWALAVIGLARALQKSAPIATVGESIPAKFRGGWVAAALAGLLPLGCFLTSLDVGYVTVCATGFVALALLVGGARFGGSGRQARLAGAVTLAALVLSCAGFVLWLGERRETFFHYHAQVFADKGWFDSLPLQFADAFTPAKAVYVLAPPVAVVLAALLWWRQGRRTKTGDAAAATPGGATPTGERYSIALLGLTVAAALYYKKGLDRSDTAHFEQAAALTPVLIAALVGWLATQAELRGRRGLPLMLFGGLLCWLGLQQSVETYASHPSRLDIWGLRQPTDATMASSDSRTIAPRAGALHCAAEQQWPLRETLAYIQQCSAPGEPIYDFTNSGLWPYLAERPNPARYSQTFHALNDAMQLEVIADLENNPPVLVLFPENAATVDFVDLTLRQRRISAWLLKHYRPVAHVGYYVMLAPKTASAAALAGMEYRFFNPVRFLAAQDQGFVPRTFADHAATDSAAGGLTPVFPDPAVQPRPELMQPGIWSHLSLKAPWRYTTAAADGKIAIALPRPIQLEEADWLEIEMAVSGGTHGGLTFLTEGAHDPQARTEAWWRQIVYRIEPVKQAAAARKYRFHLAAMANWKFLPGKIDRLELQPTDTAGIAVEIHSIRFFKESDR